jgi:hypothetical protein
MKLYACSSLYNLLITLVKILPTGEKIDLLLYTQMPNYKVIADKLKNLNCFNDIYILDTLDYRSLKYYGKIDKLFRMKRKTIEYVEKRFSLDWERYGNNIYLFNDYDCLGRYLVAKKIYYHLLEDGIDFFTYFHKYYQLSPIRYDPASTGLKILNWLSGDLGSFGASKYAIDIEVNSKKQIVISSNKVFEVPRISLFTNLRNEDRMLIYSLFCPTSTVIDQYGSKSMLLCTQPLYKDRLIPSMKMQEQIYRDIIEQYISMNYHIVIKAHPRDDCDYTIFCENYQCQQIDKYIPTEVLNFNPQISFDLALSISTTAIEQITYVKERRYLGFDFLNKYKSC